MTLTAFILIFASVILHALWHFICKSARPVPAFYMVVSASCLCTTLPFALTSGIDLTRLRAYRLADVSLAYPLARALPVIMTAFVTVLLGIGATPSPLELFGMLIIMSGCVLMPMKNFSDLHWKNYWNRALLGILVAAAGTTGYTIFDSEGVRLLLANEDVARWHGAAAYSSLRESVLLLTLSCYVFAIPHERARVTKDLFCHPHPYLAGIGAALAYLLILIAMGFVTNVCFVQAFRQMSLPVGVLLGMFFLHEKCSAAKLTGVALIVCGLILTVL